MTSVEVLQELLHRYVTAARWPRARVAFDDFNQLMSGRLEAIHPDDLDGAAELADAYHAELSARDLLHLAVMRRIGCEHIVTADTAFSGLPGVVRLDPADIATWRDET